MKYNLRLNIKTISIAERLLNKSYSEFSHDSEEELTILLYAMVLANNNEVFTLVQFKKLIFNEKIKKEMLSEAEKALLFIAQFNNSDKETSTNSESNTSDDMKIGDVANVLITNGVDAHYVMYEMNLYEMEGLMKQISEMKKERLEEGRLWAYYSVLPHTQGIKEPSDLIVFPWERDENIRLSEMYLERDLERFNEFMEKGIDYTK